jgi:hypothetical protein
VLLGIEYRHFSTLYSSGGLARAGHVNVAIGFDL